MLSAISITIWRFRKYLVLSLVISMIAIPFANYLVIERDRNRNEMYGEAFWRFGFNVYSMTDDEVAEAMGYNPENYTLPDYLGNVTYEYPVFGLIFFAIAAWLFPGQGGVQPLWLNFILTLVFNLNLVLVAILLGERIFKKNWARMLFSGYYVYGLIMSAGGGKLEPIVDCLLLMALVLNKENQHGKAMFALGLSVQTKIYSVVALPILFILSPLSIIWFFASTLLTVIPFLFLGADFSTLLSHFLNTTEYSSYVVNPIYPGLFLGTPEVSSDPVTYYMWPPALIPAVIYLAFMLMTFRMYLPSKTDFAKASLRAKFQLLFPLYIYILPAILFVFRWVMPWYLFWLGPMIFLFNEDRHAVGYLKQLVVVGLVYALGIFCNLPYFLSGPLPDFMIHFPLGWYTLLGLVLLLGSAAVAYGIWKWTFERREKKAQMIREASARGELIV
ncbi:MAG: hypothetical protein ACXADO_02575 [Candidatus Thorarchaeota archaeon]|jgi:hypothetical protein